MRRLVAAVMTCALAACSKPSEPMPDTVKPGSSMLLIKVDGMQRGEGGKTWMAWPDSVKKALEGLKGVTRVEMDLERDLFRVTLAERDAPTQEALFNAIRDLTYTPSVASAGTFKPADEPTDPMGAMPELVRDAIARAKAESKRFILVDCMGDNWVACRKMSVKTFAHPEVKKLIDQHFVLVELNVDHAKEAAGWFAGKAIPDTWILDLDGRMLDRVVGFVEPEAFAARLTKILERR